MERYHFDMGFCDDELVDVESGSKGGSDCDGGNLNLLTVLLDDREERSNLKEPAVEEDVKPQSALISRIKEMEKEITSLRQQVKAVQKNVPSCTYSKADQSKPSCLSSKKSCSEGAICLQGVNIHSETSDDIGGKSVSSRILSLRREADVAGVSTEKYSGLRIKNPLISSEQMKKRMEGRKMVRLKCISSRIKNGDIEGDWVTMGVIVDKIPPRDTAKGKKFSVWKLSDLSGQTAVISLFLFGDAFQSHWKTSIGTVVAILNPNNMPDRDGRAKTGFTHQNIAFSIDNSMKLMIMGISQDYVTCKGVTKGGKRCTNFANLSDGGYCDYHVRKAYNATKSHRMECQNGYGPSAVKGTLKDKLFQHSKTEVFYYGGQSFSAPTKSCPSKVVEDKQPSSHLFTAGSSVTFSKMLESRRRGARILAQNQNNMIETTGGCKAKSSGKSPLELLNEHRSSLPLLGKGLQPGSDVDLSTSRKLTMTAFKRNALKTVKKKGSMSSSTTPNARIELIKQRVQKSRAEIECDQDEGVEMPSSPKKQKKSSAEVFELIKAKSSRDWINQEVEVEKEEEYFEKLEKREAIEVKKDSITELRVSVVQCKVCKYIAESPSQFCTKEGHNLSRMNVLKRGFACMKCNEKSFTYNQKWPVNPCNKCGANSYIHSSLYYERKGPLLPTEQLLVRGIEEKFLS